MRKDLFYFGQFLTILPLIFLIFSLIFIVPEFLTSLVYIGAVIWLLGECIMFYAAWKWDEDKNGKTTK